MTDREKLDAIVQELRDIENEVRKDWREFFNRPTDFSNLGEATAVLDFITIVRERIEGMAK